MDIPIFFKAAAAKAAVGIYISMMKDLGPGNVPWPAAKKEAK